MQLTSAGNRPDWHYAELVAALAKSFDHFVCYEWEFFRRGRAPGEITGLLKKELLRQGVEPDSIDAARLRKRLEDAFGEIHARRSGSRTRSG